MEQRRLITKPHRAVTQAQRFAKKKLLFITLQRARARAVTIEGEDLLNDPDLMDEPEPDEFEAFEVEAEE